MTLIQRSAWRAYIGAGAMLCLAACSVAPAAGPLTRDVTGDSAEQMITLVPLAPDIVTKLDAVEPASLATTFGDKALSAPQILASGDVVAVTIWDAGGGLFSPSGPGQAGTQTTLVPNQLVDPKGNITVPFAGQVRVAGLSIPAAQQAVMRSLASQTVKPQAVITLVQDQSNLVTVMGEVKTPGRVVMNPNGLRILDAVAMAGGTVAPAYDNVVQLTRKGKTSRLRLSWVLSHPEENIYLRPDDVLYIVRNPVSVSVLGAVKTNVKIDFNAEQMSLAEAIGESGGLLDTSAEPAGIFVFRMEPASVVNMLKGSPAPATPAADDPLVPVIFRADLRQTTDFFLAQSFKMQDKDLVYVANAELAQIDKVLKVLLHAAGIAGVLTNKNGIAATD